MRDNIEESEEENSSTPVSQFSIRTRIPELPEEIIKEIIFLLPLDSLLKFRCVSPSWLSFIDSPYFLKTHLAKSTPKIILNSSISTYVLDINTVNPKPACETSVSKLCCPHPDTNILSSCNGILLTQTKPCDFLRFGRRYDVVLQNPFTRSFHKIPFVKYKYPGPDGVVCSPFSIVYGIGYDAATDDYKVLRNCQYIGCSVGKPFYSHVTVYSLKMKSHKHVEPFPHYIKRGMTESVFVGGALHWLVGTTRRNDPELIASFDVSTEEYRLVDQPVYSRGNFELNVHVLGGCLCVVCNDFPLGYNEVWVMKEYGNVDSWSKLLSVTCADVMFADIGPLYLKPLFYSECGKQVLIHTYNRRLLWYDLEKKSAEFVELDWHQVPKYFTTLLHLESLVKLSSRGRGTAPKKMLTKRKTSCPKDST